MNGVYVPIGGLVLLVVILCLIGVSIAFNTDAPFIHLRDIRA